MCAFTSLAISIGVLLIVTWEAVPPSYEYFKSDRQNASLRCASDDVIKSTNCLHQELLEFFNYNASNVGKEMTFEELKTGGGVCSHYSKWYIKRAEELGFRGEYVVMYSIGHAVAMITHHSNETNQSTYCLVDQTNKPVCNRLGSINYSITK